MARIEKLRQIGPEVQPHRGRRVLTLEFVICFDEDEVSQSQPVDCEVALFDALPGEVQRPSSGWLQTRQSTSAHGSHSIRCSMMLVQSLGDAGFNPDVTARVRACPRPVATEAWSVSENPAQSEPFMPLNNAASRADRYLS